MTKEKETKDTLALLGGDKAVTSERPDLFAWPIVTERHEQAVLDVLRSRRMSGIELTKQFERKYAQALGRKYGLAYHNGTAAILGAMYGLGVGLGDEVICPSITYWASVAQAYTLGATPVFADVDPETICINPADIEHRIMPRTKAPRRRALRGHAGRDGCDYGDRRQTPFEGARRCLPRSRGFVQGQRSWHVRRGVGLLPD